MKDQTVLDVYARVSRLGDKRLRSIEGQVVDCTTRVKDHGARVGNVHIDPGRSAWNPKAKRPGWNALMARLASGETDGVVVFDLSRFSRRGPQEGQPLIDAAKRGLTVLDSENEYDLTTAGGIKAFRDQLTSAAYESDRLSTRVKRGKRLKALKGESNHSGRPFGFEADGITHRPSEAAELRSLARRFLAGKSQDALIEELTRRGVRTTYDKEWSRTGLRQLLTRPRNAGLVEYDGEILEHRPGEPMRLRAPRANKEPLDPLGSDTAVGDEDAVEPILDLDTFNRILATYAARRRGRPTSEPYPCSGIVQCGLCEWTLSGRPRRNMKPYPDGGVRRQYWCQPRPIRGGCGRIAVDQRELDRHVRELVIAILSDPRHAAVIEAAARAAADRRREIEAEIAECEHLAEVLAERLGRREISLARHDAAVGPLDRRLVELRAELEALPLAGVVDASADVVAASRADWAARWDVGTVSQRRALLRQALRGRKLLVMPADRTAPRRFDRRRVVLV